MCQTNNHSKSHTLYSFSRFRRLNSRSFWSRLCRIKTRRLFKIFQLIKLKRKCMSNFPHSTCILFQNKKSFDRVKQKHTYCMSRPHLPTIVLSIDCIELLFAFVTVLTHIFRNVLWRPYSNFRLKYISCVLK